MSVHSRDRAEKSLSMVKICVQDMAEAGFGDEEIATALGFHMLEAIGRKLPDNGLRKIWLDCLVRL